MRYASTSVAGNRSFQVPSPVPKCCGLSSQAEEAALATGRRVLDRVDLVRVNDRVLNLASTLLPLEVPSLDAIHLATATRLGAELGDIVTYDERTAAAARSMGYRGSAPT
jgi:predicted nucleic acid-binding protein